MTASPNKAPLPGPIPQPRTPGGGCHSHAGDRSAFLRELSRDAQLIRVVHVRANVPWLAAVLELHAMQRDGLVEIADERVRLTDAGFAAKRALVKSDLDDWREAEFPWERLVFVVLAVIALVAIGWGALR